MSAGLIALAIRFARPWIRSLPASRQRTITTVPVFGYVAMLLMATFLGVLVAPSDRAAAALVFLMVWILHFAAGPTEPSDFPLERLPGRMARAAALRVFAMCCGAISVIWLIQYSVHGKRYEAALFAMIITVGLAVVAASLKVFARVRRLSTELHRRSLTVIRGLEELRDVHEPDEARRLGRTVVRAWDGLDEVLHNKVETGFHLNGTFVLPRDAIRSLEAAVMAAVEAPTDDHLHQVAVDRMNILRAAGKRRLDSFA